MPDNIELLDGAQIEDESKVRELFGVDQFHETSDDKRIALAPPEIPHRCVFRGRENELRMCKAAFGVSADWSNLDNSLEPLHFRLEGPPGVGKNEIVYEIARKLAVSMRMPFYSIQGHEEMTPEDLSILVVPDSDNSRDLSFTLRASPLATALYEGGLFFFDEINRAPERALTPLASVLDKRQSLYSAMTGITIRPKEGVRKRFRFCCAMNPDHGRTGRGGLSDYLDERTLPAIGVGYHDLETLAQILQENVTSERKHLDDFRKWYEDSKVQEISVRQAIALVTFSLRALEPGKSLRHALQDNASRVIGKVSSKDDNRV